MYLPDSLLHLKTRLAVDAERARNWTIVQTMAWSFDTPYRAHHLNTVRWLIEG